MSSTPEYLPGRPAPVKFTLRDRKLILGLRSLPSQLAGRFRLPAVRRGRIIILLDGYDMCDLMCQAANAAAREDDPRKRRALEKLRRKLPLLFDLRAFLTATDTDYRNQE